MPKPAVPAAFRLMALARVYPSETTAELLPPCRSTVRKLPNCPMSPLTSALPVKMMEPLLAPEVATLPFR